MHWLLKSPEHQQTWYWLCGHTASTWYCCSRVNFTYLGQANSKTWFKMWIYLLWSLKQISMLRVKISKFLITLLLTDWGRVMHKCISNLTIIGSDNDLSSYYLNQCWNIVNWTLRNRLQWNFHRNLFKKIHLKMSAKMVAILSRGRWVKTPQYGEIHGLYFMPLLNSPFSPGRCESNFKSVISECMSWIKVDPH